MSQTNHSSQRSRGDAITDIIRAYLDLPDTPAEASPRDFNIATALVNGGVNVDLILRAIKIGFVRRWVRDHSAGPLPPIRSLAYFRAVLNGLSDDDLSDDYAFYIDYKFAQIRPNPQAWVDQQTRMINPASNPSA
jgi:hypothetical protein